MPVNQLYHDRGVALTRAHHSVSAGERSGHATSPLRNGEGAPSGDSNYTADLLTTGDRFEIFREDEVQVSSTQFAGGDWRWRLTDSTGKTLVEGNGYRSKRACMVAVSLLRDRAFSAR